MSNEKENTSVISFEDAPLPIASIKPLPREEVKTKIDFSQTWSEEANDTAGQRFKGILDDSSIWKFDDSKVTAHQLT